MRGSIRKRLTLAFIGLAIGPLLLVGVILAWQSFITQKQQALNLQREVAQHVSFQVKAFLDGLENELRLVSQVQGLQKLDRDKQRTILAELLSYQDAFDSLVLLDSQGQEQVHLARASVIPAEELGNRTKADEFVIPQTGGRTYYSAVHFNKTTGEPFITMAVPLQDIRTGLVNGVLVSEVRLGRIWDLIMDLQTSPGQSVYIVDAQNKVVAHRNASVVLRGTTFHVPNQDGIQAGLASVNPILAVDTREGLSIRSLVARLTSPNVVLAVDTVRFGEQEFNIIAEQTVAEALALAITTILVTVSLIVVALVMSVALGLVVVRRIVQPIQAMATTAQAISAGDLSQQVKVVGHDEVGVLANAFNSMTAQLRNLIDNLEQQVIRRTRQIETVVEISRQLTGILQLSDLLCQIVTLTKETFNYYHVHIYLLNEGQDALVLAEGYGQAGETMKRQGHYIPLDASASLVARAARQGRVVISENVQRDSTWLSNPLLPQTLSEMAVPIVKEKRVVGVLDVQSDKLSGLSEEDANLLSSLANQVAVALTNAQLYHTEKELRQAEVERAQELAKVNADLKTAQAELLRQERLATLGQLTATVSHEIRNPLATIRASIFMVDTKTRNKGLGVEQALDRIQRNITRCDNIIGELLDYTRMGELNLRLVWFDDWLNQLLDEQTVREGITLVRELNAAVEVSLDPSRFQRVIINLFDNACQAMLEYTKSNNGTPPLILSIHSEVVDQQLKISISDTGPGISPDIMPHIFEPLYSTKGFGVGLGLPIVKEIMRQHEGNIEITSEVGQGTQAILWLPLLRPERNQK